MDIEVHARHVEVADDIRKTATRKTERLGRYLAGVERADVFFSTCQSTRAEAVTCEVVLEGHGHVVRASADSLRPEAALDLAVQKAELRLTKLKTKLVDRSRPRHANGKKAADLAVEDEGASEESE
jgi:ribosomal subunit interface protein